MRCEAVLFHALGDSDDRKAGSSILRKFRRRLQDLLDLLFPEGPVPWAWWDCNTSEGTTEDNVDSSAWKLGRSAQGVIRASVLVDPVDSCTDPALQLIQICFPAFTPARVSVLGKIMGFESIRGHSESRRGSTRVKVLTVKSGIGRSRRKMSEKLSPSRYVSTYCGVRAQGHVLQLLDTSACEIVVVPELLRLLPI